MNTKQQFNTLLQELEELYNQNIIQQKKIIKITQLLQKSLKNDDYVLEKKSTLSTDDLKGKTNETLLNTAASDILDLTSDPLVQKKFQIETNFPIQFSQIFSVRQISQNNKSNMKLVVTVVDSKGFLS
jgi:uncharacterized protein YqgQ